MVVRQLVAIYVLPPHEQRATVGQHPWRVFLFGIVRHHADVAAVAVAAIQDGHLSAPAGHEAVATAGTEHDPAVGQVDGLDVVVRPVGQLPQTGTVDIDLVEVISFAAAGSIRKQDLLAVIMDVRVPNTAARVFQQHFQAAGPQVESAQLRPFAESKAFPVAFDEGAVRVVRIIAIVPEVPVPMVAPRDPLREHDFVEIGRRAVEELLQQGTWLDRLTLGDRFRFQQVLCGRFGQPHDAHGIEPATGAVVLKEQPVDRVAIAVA